jgi:hypothetical protein
MRHAERPTILRVLGEGSQSHSSSSVSADLSRLRGVTAFFARDRRQMICGGRRLNLASIWNLTIESRVTNCPG